MSKKFVIEYDVPEHLVYSYMNRVAYITEHLHQAIQNHDQNPVNGPLTPEERELLEFDVEVGKQVFRQLNKYFTTFIVHEHPTEKIPQSVIDVTNEIIKRMMQS